MTYVAGRVRVIAASRVHHRYTANHLHPSNVHMQRQILLGRHDRTMYSVVLA